MSVLITPPYPPSIESFLDGRRRTGADRFDEMWEGVLHVAPAPTGAHGDLLLQVMEQLGPLARQKSMVPSAGGFNLGSAADHRIPDGGIRRTRSGATYFDTAALVVEILSPGDETFAKLPFYAEHAVDGVVILDPLERSVRWLGLESREFADIEHSSVIALGPGELAENIDWPPLT